MASCVLLCMLRLLWSSSSMSYSLFNWSKSPCRVTKPQKHTKNTMLMSARFEIKNPFVCGRVDGVYSTCVWTKHLLEGLFVWFFQSVQVALWVDIQVFCFHPVELLLDSSWVECRNSIITAFTKLFSLWLSTSKHWREAAASTRWLNSTTNCFHSRHFIIINNILKNVITCIR